MIAAYIHQFRRWLARMIEPDPVIVDLKRKLSESRHDPRYDPKQFRRPR